MDKAELHKAIEHHYGSGILMAFTDLIHEEREMITCKEDLINTYIEKGNPELTKAYLDACEPYVDVHLSRNDKWPDDSHFYFNPTYNHVQSGECDTEQYKQLTLADLKPRTRTEYVKVEPASIDKSMLDDVFIDNSGETSIRDASVAEFLCCDLYRRIETPITERDAFIEELSKIQKELGDCQLGEFYNAIFDSGKFKLTDKE